MKKHIVIMIDETKGLSYKGRVLKDVARQKGYHYYENVSEFIEDELKGKFEEVSE